MEDIRKRIFQAFKMEGLAATSDGTLYLCEILKEFSPAQQTIWLEKIVFRVHRQKLESSLIDKGAIEIAAKECGKGDSQNPEDALHIIDAFDIPKLVYDVEKKKFTIDENLSLSIVAGPDEKAQLFKDRYSVLLQRTLHHELFSPTVQGIDLGEGKAKFTLRTVEFLIGSSTKIDDVIILGMITHLKDAHYHLEDPTGAVELNLTEAVFQSGLYAQNCFVLAEGYYDDQVFHVTALGLPPPEESKLSRTFYGSTNFFGGPPTNLNKERLDLIERQNQDTFFVILCDVFMDKPEIADKLRVLFGGFAEARPLLFIFMGNFISRSAASISPVSLRDSLRNLADIILEFPTLVENSHFVFIPGPRDPCFANILPRPAFADVITEYVRMKLPNVTFASNPCRIKYCTKEIVVFREDIIQKFTHMLIKRPKEGAYEDHFVRTLIGQSHLAPLPLTICPVYWSFDHALSLYPLPNLVIIGDRSPSFTITRNGCTFLNPGSFMTSSFSFKTYIPFENKIEDCQLPPDT